MLPDPAAPPDAALWRDLLLYPLWQRWHPPQVADVAGEVRRKLLDSQLPKRLAPGARVAVGVGSRGINRLEEITRAVITTLKELQAQPFIVAAMGSHGGATPAGQRDLLASYGITEENLGVPVRTEMDTVHLGQNSWGEPVYWDRHAFEADAVVTVSRIKPHTDFTGSYESGIVKMLVIGLGKREGAATHHQYGVRGLRDMIPASAEVILGKTKFLLGLGIVENALDQPALIEAVDLEDLFVTEPKLLKQARNLMPRLPFTELDLLVVGELGKNFSGTGMDVHVIGRHFVEGEPDLWQPRITRLCVLDVSAESHGNAVGLGLADLTTRQALARRDERITDLNYLTSCFLLRAKTPIALETDAACVAMGIKTCWQPRRERLRMAVIPNTLELEQLWVTAPLRQEAEQYPHLELGERGLPLPFAPDGALRQEELFPHSVRTRRRTGAGG